MTINLNCKCGKELLVDDRYAGKRGKCPACGTFLQIPSPENALAPPLDPVQASTTIAEIPAESATTNGNEGNQLREGTAVARTLIDKYRADYNEARRIIDFDVEAMIREGKEMRALMLMGETIVKISELHESLSGLYSCMFRGTEVLQRFGSQRLQQLGHSPLPICSILKEFGNDESEAEHMVLKELHKVGINCKHWFIKEVFVGEMEYMLDALQILIEPDFIPLDDATADGDELDRYIPPAVKLAVWRRDQGKCVQCGSKDRLEYDHIIPASKGGSNTERNIQLLCERCNREKAARIA